MPFEPIVALEIGTTKTVALVGEMRDDGSVLITGMGEHPSTGVRKGEITDLENALVCVRAALHAAEESGQVTIQHVHVALSGGHIQSVVNRGSTPVLSPDREITDEDVKQVMNIARAVNLPPDREPLHTICQHFYIDDEEEVLRPEGLEGARLSLDMLTLYGVRTRLHNTIKVVRSVPMAVQDAAFSGLCSALAVLTPEQKECGVLLIDLGGGTTDYVAYARDALAAAGALGVGGDHVTNDIALAFTIPIRQAERLKRESASAVLDATARTRRISLPAEVGFAARSISLDSLHLVTNARMQEIFAMIKRRLEAADILHHIGAGVILTGGGAHLKDVTTLAEQVFELPCTIGVPKGVSGLAAASSEPEYATAVGLVRYGFKAASSSASQSSFGRFMKRVLGLSATKFDRI